MKIENFFKEIINKEIIAFQFCENLESIISQSSTSKTLQIKPSSPSYKKNQYSERIDLTEENDSLLKNCEEVAKELTNFLFNAVKNLVIPSYENCDSFAENVNDSTLKAIVKWKNHPSILDRTNYCFNFVSKENIQRPSRRIIFQLNH